MRPFGTILGPFWDHFGPILGPILGPIFGYYQFDVWTNLRPIVLFQKLSNEVSFNAIPYFFALKSIDLTIFCQLQKGKVNLDTSFH